MSPPNSFDPNSPNAMFATILQRLDEQDRRSDERHTSFLATQAELRKDHAAVDQRVSTLERDRWYQRGIVAAVGVFAAGAFDFWKNSK